MNAKLQKALDELLDRIGKGGEFPDAAWTVAQKHRVDQTELESAYNEEGNT